MKPLKLEFAGLNSYRDGQTVDFEHLGRSGLFGIFGPTGAGKSSILDAITLALYGKVDRADNNTRGIINLREKVAEVSFTFELGGSRYTVQRRYERPAADPESARAKTARLTKGDSEVLADKPETVTQRVEAIIGLTCQEFCRAVVLPQGKFSEFLTLAGAKRAEMLGHIFDLDRFGEPLFQKASERRDKWQREVDGLERAKAELGDCSDAAIAKAQTSVEVLQTALLQAERDYRKGKSEYEETAKLKSLYDQLRVAQERKAALDGEKADIEEAQASLDSARRAMPLRNIIETIKRLALDRVKTHGDLAIACAGLDDAKSALETAVKAARIALEQKDREESVLTARRTRLEEALGVQGQLSALRKKQESLAAAFESLKEDVMKERASLETREAHLRQVGGLVESLRTKQAELSVDPLIRDRVGEAFRLIEPLQLAEKEHVSSQSGLERKTAEVEKARAKVLRVFGELAGLAASRYTWDESGHLVAGQAEIPSVKDAQTGEEFLRVADREIDIALRLVREADERANRAFIQDQAAVLAKSLQEGRPCPVCGSAHHPCVAAGDAERSTVAQEAKSVAEICLTKLQKWRSGLQDCTSSWDNLRVNELEAWEKVQEWEGGIRTARDSFLAAARAALENSFSEETARADIQAAKNRIAAKDREYSLVSRSLLETQNKETAARKELDDARARLSGLEKDRDTTAKELTLVAEQVVERETRIQEIAGGEDPEAAIPAVDSAIQALRERVKQAQTKEDSCRKEAERLGQQVAKLESTLFQVEKELQKQKTALAEGLTGAGFDTEEQAEKAILSDADVQALDSRIQQYWRECATVDGQVSQLAEQIGSRQFSEPEFREMEARVKELETRANSLREESAVALERLDTLKRRRNRWDSLEAERLGAEKKRDVAARLANLLRGKAFVQFLSEEHLRDMAVDASTRLGSLTGQRYALEISGKSDFLIRDDYNGGERRSVGTLSGGETFLTSLSLALALSSKVQLRGQYPLGFFFLDEGFGSLDDEKLDAVISALERLHDKDRIVGVISHVKELKERLPYYLEVTPPRGDGAGSRISQA